MVRGSAGIVRLPAWVIGPCDGSGQSGSDVSGVCKRGRCMVASYQSLTDRDWIGE